MFICVILFYVLLNYFSTPVSNRTLDLTSAEQRSLGTFTAVDQISPACKNKRTTFIPVLDEVLLNCSSFFPGEYIVSSSGDFELQL